MGLINRSNRVAAIKPVDSNQRLRTNYLDREILICDDETLFPGRRSLEITAEENLLLFEYPYELNRLLNWQTDGVYSSHEEELRRQQEEIFLEEEEREDYLTQKAKEEQEEEKDDRAEEDFYEQREEQEERAEEFSDENTLFDHDAYDPLDDDDEI